MYYRQIEPKSLKTWQQEDTYEDGKLSTFKACETNGLKEQIFTLLHTENILDIELQTDQIKPVTRKKAVHWQQTHYSLSYIYNSRKHQCRDLLSTQLFYLTKKTLLNKHRILKKKPTSELKNKNLKSDECRGIKPSLRLTSENQTSWNTYFLILEKFNFWYLLPKIVLLLCILLKLPIWDKHKTDQFGFTKV